MRCGMTFQNARYSFRARAVMPFNAGEPFSRKSAGSPRNESGEFEFFRSVQDWESYVALLATAHCASAA
jgi:hypothetical protein